MDRPSLLCLGYANQHLSISDNEATGVIDDSRCNGTLARRGCSFSSSQMAGQSSSRLRRLTPLVVIQIKPSDASETP
jgi:hypothetical protein